MMYIPRNMHTILNMGLWITKICKLDIHKVYRAAHTTDIARLECSVS